ncbi:hypothetical protein Glove_66g75 [Diversispora epigaea]|uniref:Uncharacterized protein n=1 Tax=Diversispora epigaea TaxID=1348612 RepID=A0A397JCT9_9GLOM|nr:hypothetical protein Glove_66g75 [Diversispora epigaea]
MSSCAEKGYHKEDIKKNFQLLIQWLLNIAKDKNSEYQKNILATILPQIIPFFNSNTSQHNSCNYNIPSYFVLKTIMKINQIPINFQERELDEEEYKEIGQKMGQELWKSSKYLKKNKNILQNPKNLNSYINTLSKPLVIFFESMLTLILKNKITESNRKQYSNNKPSKKVNLQKVNTLLSLLISSLVNFAFPYSNLWLPSVLASLCRRPKLLSSLYDLLTKWSIIGRTTRHERRLEKTRMENADPTKCLLNGTNIFNLAVIDNIDFKEKSFQFGNIYDVTQGTSHATLRMVFQFTLPEIINKKPEPLHGLDENTQLFGMSQVINDNIYKFNKIFENLLAFRHNEKEELKYNKDFDLTIVDSEILKQINFGCKLPPPNVIILEPSRSPNDDNEIHIYVQKTNTKIEEILSGLINKRICLRIWYLYYKWFTIWKIHLTGIRCGNYELQKFGLVAFAPLFPAAGKNNYTTSVTHFLSILEKYPQLEQKLHYCASINLARKGHYPAYDEALETHDVAYIKQNITGNSCNQENLELQIKATQEERERIDTLLNDF